ncbi:NAD(P)H-binding protein [Kitasatospora phosalacinea]|uniref:NAD(P)H-binding protein n=1 Tax=Kitasatospora phosalacinea TaxID=2065 RepID=UPI00068BD7FD|nr:NAD(P)H-binding protein [Kitasatospora phosalacinea]
MIVVTAPTGAVGRLVLSGLLAAERPVRVVVRDPGRLPAGVRGRVEVVRGSHGDPEVVDRAFAGARSVFWLVPPDVRATDPRAAFSGFTRPACTALVRHGVERVVGVSALGAHFTGPAGLVTASLEVDRLIASTGVAYRALAMPAFMENLLQQAGAIRAHGEFCSVIEADLRLPTVAARDVARAAVRLLLDEEWRGSGSVPVLGPEDLSFREIAAIATEVLGRPVRYRQVSAERFRAVLTGAGLSAQMAAATVEMLEAKNAGLDGAEPRTALTASPTTFRSWCAQVLRPAVEEVPGGAGRAVVEGS